MALKNIEVFVDATPEGQKRTHYAATVAHQCGAHLAGIHVVSAGRPEHRSVTMWLARPSAPREPRRKRPTTP